MAGARRSASAGTRRSARHHASHGLSALRGRDAALHTPSRIAAGAGILCMPGIHDMLMAFAAKNPYLTVVIPALLAVAALYHDPKKTS